MNLLVTGAWHDAKEHITQLEEFGHVVCFMQNEQDMLPRKYEWVEGVICNGLFLHHPIEKFINLKYIQLTSAGFDRVPLEYVQEHHIKIHNARGVYSIPMAEYAVCGVLQLYKQMSFFYENQKTHKWEKHRGLMELAGKTVCLVGCGSVGTECAKRFAAFDCTVVGVDIAPREDKHYAEIVSLEHLDQALVDADVVVLTVPLTEQTQHLMNAARFATMKQDAVLVNISRGGIVDTEALINALNAQLGGAVLDVFEEEPLPQNSLLWDLENVTISSHNSFVSDGNHNRLFGVIKNNLEGICNEKNLHRNNNVVVHQ